MIRVCLDVDDPTQRLMLQALLERAGFQVVNDRFDVAICDDFERAVETSLARPALVLTGMNDVPRAVQAMENGVWGYILLPLQPGEAELMVQRAARGGSASATFQPRPLAEIEAEHILAVLRHCNGNRSKAARLLGVGRNTLWRKLAAMETREEDDVER